MDKMFKRTLLGAAVSLAAVSGSANAAIELAGQAVQVYGQAAGGVQLWSPSGEGKDNTVVVDIESRIGFRGVVEFDDFAPDFVWQIEGQNANNSTNGGQFGARDTYIGFAFDGLGSFKFGRQLVAAYNYVDWPHSNPGLGNVFDWHNAIDASYADRTDNNLRFDSVSFGGFNIQATLSGMGSTTDALVSSVGASFSRDSFSIHGGYYHQGEYDTSGTNDAPIVKNPTTGDYEINKEFGLAVLGKGGDVSYAIVGGSAYLGDVTLTAAFKNMQNNRTDDSQDAFSATAQYVIGGQWVLKAGYAATSESDKKIKSKGADDSSTAITGRLGYLLPSTYLYADVRNYDMLGDTKGDDGTRFIVGAEYYF
ncbi:porin [Vibrio sp. YMD68]|uniref:porin n=1 Tax=Vibrio sp. YMD68 TaxID=3042300 RepID=UPI00249A7E8D|nr:porin [Vibrio sp. YMD68]WGW01119.1 porin [Vibrio sp. YMD68]